MVKQIKKIWQKYILQDYPSFSNQRNPKEIVKGLKSPWSLIFLFNFMGGNTVFSGRLNCRIFSFVKTLYFAKYLFFNTANQYMSLKVPFPSDMQRSRSVATFGRQ